MITTKDVGKLVFLRVTDDNTHKQEWINDGVRLQGFSKEGDRILVKLKDGRIWAIRPDFVRVFEPRPGIP